MSNFNWNYPTTMWVGENRINDLSKACLQLDIKKPLIVTDEGLAKSKIFLESIARLEVKGIRSNIIANETCRFMD